MSDVEQWPGVPVAPFDWVEGTSYPSPVASPAAGADWTYTVPGGFYERIVAISYRMVSANAGVARQSVLRFKDADGNVIFTTHCAAQQQINVTQDYSYFDSGPAQNIVNGVVLGCLPTSLYLYSGFSIASDTLNINAADQFSRIFVWRERVFRYGIGG